MYCIKQTIQYHNTPKGKSISASLKKYVVIKISLLAYVFTIL